MHVLPELKKLEEKYPELVVIGVHSAKFNNEKTMENIRQAVLRYGIEHPIIIDNNVHYYDNALYVADSYNHKIKKIDMGQRMVTMLVGTGSIGRNDGIALNASLNEPNDVAVLDGIFYIADTINHAIRVYNPKNGNVSTINFETSQTQRKDRAIELTERSILPESKGIYFQLMLPEGYHWNKDAENQ